MRALEVGGVTISLLDVAGRGEVLPLLAEAYLGTRRLDEWMHALDFEHHPVQPKRN